MPIKAVQHPDRIYTTPWIMDKQEEQWVTKQDDFPQVSFKCTTYKLKKELSCHYNNAIGVGKTVIMTGDMRKTITLDKICVCSVVVWINHPWLDEEQLEHSIPQWEK